MDLAVKYYLEVLCSVVLVFWVFGGLLSSFEGLPVLTFRVPLS
jgi:hypothetical protein